VTALAASQPQGAADQDAATREGFEIVLDEPGQLGAGVGLGVGDEARSMLLHQAVQRGLLGAVAFVADRAPSGARWGRCAVARTMGSRWGEPARSQTALRASIALMAASRRVPSVAGPPTGDCEVARPAASGRRDQDGRCLFRVGIGLSHELRAAPWAGKTPCAGRRSDHRQETPATQRCPERALAKVKTSAF